MLNYPELPDGWFNAASEGAEGLIQKASNCRPISP